MKRITADEIIKALDLIPLTTEGGFFRQTWRDEYGTVIYYLITPESWSSLHRLTIAETWHFYAGDPLKQLQIFPDGRTERVEFSTELLNGQRPQLICPADVWQATRLAEGGEWALTGTTMAPGYTEDCIEFTDPEELAGAFPQHMELIKEFS
ncbi:MAG TPA: hypothetical protein DCO79_04510 [Spirochaeta sp.]|nr:hypothetical protein [Spirochaeta sp.]